MHHRFFAVALFAALAPGCATALKTKQATIPVSSATPGAEVLVDGQNVGVTPTQVSLSTKSEHVITVRGQGKEESCRLATSASGGWIVLDILLTGGIGLIVDYATNAWNNFDKSECRVSL